MATAGFGDGTIILFTFFALAVVLSIIGFQIQRPATLTTIGFGIFLILLLVFAVIPKEDSEEPEEPTDPYYTRRLAALILTVIFTAISLVIYLVQFGLSSVKATRAHNSILLRNSN